MARLVYSGIVSLDGYINDASGAFDWSEPDDAVHAAVNDVQRTIGTLLLGRRMYDVLAAWDTFGTDPGDPDVIREYGELWRASQKIVYSTTLESISAPRTRLERALDLDSIRAMKTDVAADISIGGPTLAREVILAGLVDDWHLFVSPVLVGGGTRLFPDGVREELELVEERRFGNGVVCTRYRTRTR